MEQKNNPFCFRRFKITKAFRKVFFPRLKCLPQLLPCLAALACIESTHAGYEANLPICPLTTTSAKSEQPLALKETAPDPLRIVLAPMDGTSRADDEIRRYQQMVRSGIGRAPALNGLGWAFVAKARESLDSGFYKLAEICAKILESETPGSSEVLLLRGHILQNLHQFKEAEPLARRLVAQRGRSYDHALLGDVLMEQGKLKEAVAAYQAMVDELPDLHSYARVAHIRWLTGDLEGALIVMRAAVNASSSRDAGSAAWANTRLANLEFQAGQTKRAGQHCETALAYCKDYPPALVLQGKMLLASNDFANAAKLFERAAEHAPLPEYQWALTEALRAGDRESEAIAVEARLKKQGAKADPRTFSLYLATHSESSDLAVRLAENEFKERQDVFTHDALAWALLASGRVDEARIHMKAALAEGTPDARLFFHAAVVMARSGQIAEAQDWFYRAQKVINQLLPSEQRRLAQLANEFAMSASATSSQD
jgi:tetratricopeptide (TPR) repeat protein